MYMYIYALSDQSYAGKILQLGSCFGNYNWGVEISLSVKSPTSCYVEQSI